MAIIDSLAIGKARNSIGNLTYCVISGRTIARQKPTDVYNPKTVSQAKYRTQFAYAVRYWGEFGYIFAPYYTKLKGYGSAYNTCISLNNNPDKKLVDLVNGKLQMGVGYYMSSGEFPNSSISVSDRTGDNYFIVENDSLIANLRLGDQLIFFSRKMFSTDFFVSIKGLDQVTIDLIALKDWVHVELAENHNLINVIYYSPRTNKSSTANYFQQWKRRPQ